MDIYEKIIELKNKNESFAIASVVKNSGSVPGKVGFKMIIKNDGTTLGTVGGGAIEVRAIDDALALLKKNESGLIDYVLSSDKSIVGENVVPMMCNGKVWIFFESYNRNPSVYVFGGGHVGKSLLHFLKPLKFNVTLIDNRPEFSDPQKYPEADFCVTSNYNEFLEKFAPPENSYFVVLTHGHEFDFEILSGIIKRNVNHAYVGVIASKSKAADLIERLKKEIGHEFDLEKIHTPIGLKIGGDTAEEIALSIAAQIQTVRYSKSGIKK